MSQQCLLVGVHPHQPAVVVQEAAKLATSLGATLVCAYADPSRYPISEAADGTITSAPVDPDFMDDAGASFPTRLADELGRLLQAAGALWRPLLLAGDPAPALDHCAQTLGARMIIVGTHGDNRAALHGLLHHSVAVRLSRIQSRPVLVVPTHRGQEPEQGAG